MQQYKLSNFWIYLVRSTPSANQSDRHSRYEVSVEKWRRQPTKKCSDIACIWNYFLFDYTSESLHPYNVWKKRSSFFFFILIRVFASVRGFPFLMPSKTRAWMKSSASQSRYWCARWFCTTVCYYYFLTIFVKRQLQAKRLKESHSLRHVQPAASPPLWHLRLRLLWPGQEDIHRLLHRAHLHAGHDQHPAGARARAVLRGRYQGRYSCHCSLEHQWWEGRSHWAGDHSCLDAEEETHEQPPPLQQHEEEGGGRKEVSSSTKCKDSQENEVIWPFKWRIALCKWKWSKKKQAFGRWLPLSP